jgi:hypothetical protein
VEAVDNSVEKPAECRAKRAPAGSHELLDNFLHIDLILINQYLAKNTVDLDRRVGSPQSLPQRSGVNVHK